MKYLLLAILLLPLAALAQTEKDYEQALKRFISFYNNRQGDSIERMWPPEDNYGDAMNAMWGRDAMDRLHTNYGKIESYKYLGIDKEDPNAGLAVFKTKFSIAGWKTTSLTLEQKKYLGTFRLITSSPGIDKLLANDK